MSKFSNAINSARKSKDGKVLIQNFSYLAFLQIAGYIFPLITIPYLAKVIGVEGFGKIAFASAIIVWFQTVADWGFNYTATRDVAKNRDNKEKVSEIFSNVLWARCLLVLLSFALLIIAILIIPKFRENQSIILVTFLLVPGHIMFPDWFFQAMERMKYITILNILSKLLFTIAVFVFIKEKSDYILQPLFTSFGYVLSGIIAMYYILVRWKVKLLAPSFSPIISTIKGSTDVFINNLLPNFYNSFSIMLLGFFGGPASVGLLDASRKFTTIAHQFMAILSRAFFPYLSRRVEKHDVYSKLHLAISFLLSILLFTLAPFLIDCFFTSDFAVAIDLLRITAISTFFVSLSRIYGTTYLIIINREKMLRNITIICSLTGLLISIPLVYYYKSYGAAITLTIVQALLGVTIMVRALKIKKN